MEAQSQVTVLDYWRVVWRARWMILTLSVLATAVAFGLVRRQDRVYVAKATILPPREPTQSLSMSLGALLGGARGDRDGGGGFNLGGISVGGAGVTTNQDVFVALLKSRTMREEVVAALGKTWGPSTGGMLLSMQPDTKEKGVVAISVEAKDPKLASDAANMYFTQLDRMLERYADQSVKRQEGAYAVQLERAAKEVEAAETAVLKFQSEHKYIAVDATTKGGVEQGGSVRGSIMALELQREVMRMRFTDQDPQMRELDKQISEMKRLYSKNLFGEAMDLPPESPGVKGGRKEFFVATARMTPVQFAFLKVLRNLKIQEAFYIGAVQGLQQLKYGHDINTPRIEFLDIAIPPGGPVRPNAPFTVAAAAGSAFITGVLLAFVLEYLRRVRDQDRRRRRAAVAADRRDGGAEVPRGVGGELKRASEAGRASIPRG